MKNFFKKFKNYGFWTSLTAAIILFLNALGNAFGFSIENKIVEDCIMAFAGILVALGLVSKSSKTENKEKENSVSENDDNAKIDN